MFQQILRNLRLERCLFLEYAVLIAVLFMCFERNVENSVALKSQFILCETRKKIQVLKSVSISLF
jgi:hypothetical protein